MEIVGLCVTVWFGSRKDGRGWTTGRGLELSCFRMARRTSRRETS